MPAPVRHATTIQLEHSSMTAFDNHQCTAVRLESSIGMDHSQIMNSRLYVQHFKGNLRQRPLMESESYILVGTSMADDCAIANAQHYMQTTFR